MAEEEECLRWKISTRTVYNPLKKHAKYAFSVRGKRTLNVVERFRKGSVRKLYERSLYERTFMSQLFIEKHAVSIQLSYLLLIERSINANLIVHVDVT